MTSDMELEEGRQRKAFSGLMVALGVLALIVVATFGYAKWKSRGLTYDIRFGDAKSLKEGDQVTLSGYPIGQVRRIRLEDEGEVVVTVALQDEHAAKVKEGSTAIIASPRFPNVSGQKAVEIHNPDRDDAPPIKEGDVVEGQDSLVAINAWKVARRLEGVAEGASIFTRGAIHALSNMVEELKDIPESPAMQAAMENLQTLADRMGERGKEGLASFLQEWDEWLVALEPLIAKARDMGRERAEQALEATRQKLAEAQERLRHGDAATTATPELPPEAL